MYNLLHIEEHKGKHSYPHVEDFITVI